MRRRFFIIVTEIFSLAAVCPRPTRAQQPPDTLLKQAQPDADPKSSGCLSCHSPIETPSMHPTGTVLLGCTDCHGGNSQARIAAGTSSSSAQYRETKNQAHPQPGIRGTLDSSANPVRSYTRWLREDSDYIRFVNPGDLRVAEKTCGQPGCHLAEVRKVETSMMTHGAMLWGAGLYNNGAVPFKTPRFGESYGPDGQPRRLITFPAPTKDEIERKGVLPYLDPLERWEISQPGNVLRVFERGGRKRSELANPDPDEAPGKPENRLSERGFGTSLRTDPVFLGLQKTRLLDPLLSMPGTNDQPGDYRGSGCTACHVIYANDRDSEHSGHYARFGNAGRSTSGDPTIPKDESGHPLRHEFTRAIPSSQCITCHIHPGTNMVATYYGMTWWDNEMDGATMYPKQQRNASPKEQFDIQNKNPERTAIRGLWSNPDFLEKTGTPEFNQQLTTTQFGDFHSHGWIFRAVFNRDRKGNLLDREGRTVSADDQDKFKKAVHLKDIHLELGMHCIDCHLEQDSHGNGKLYGETRNAVEIDCVDCHGTIEHPANLLTSGTASPEGGTNLALLRTPWQERQFYWNDGKLYQRSMVERDKHWEVVQVADTITPGNSHYSEKSRLAKTMQRDGTTWGAVPADGSKLAHQNSKMTCYTCHASWAPTCYGCHLSMTANQR
jgi:hypothetical protein